MKFRSDSEVELRWFSPSNPDLEVVNAARVSFGKQKKELSESDTKLINYLAEHKHMSPFRHPQFSFRIKTSEICARQIYKHIVGCNYTSEGSTTKDHGWNEISGRYVVFEDEFFIPNSLRKQSISNKQGSGGPLNKELNEELLEEYKQSVINSYAAYTDLINNGVAKELARSLIPICFYTEFIWTASLEAVYHLIKLRTHNEAQQEIQDVANAIHYLTEPIAPISFKALMENSNV